jgi:hypothetical protein
MTNDNTTTQPKDMTITIGTQWRTRGKHPRRCTVIDILKTYNHEGTLVKTEYLSTHQFMGQPLQRVDVATSIKMGWLETA